MGRVYSIVFEGVAVSTQVDFFEIVPAANRPVLIHEIRLAQSSDVGDSAEEMLRVEIIRGYTTSGSGGSAATLAKRDANDSDPGATGETNNTTLAADGTAAVLLADAFNSRSGWLFVPTPECRPRCSAAEARIVVRLMAAPVDALTMSGSIIFEEI